MLFLGQKLDTSNAPLPTEPNKGKSPTILQWSIWTAKGVYWGLKLWNFLDGGGWWE